MNIDRPSVDLVEKYLEDWNSLENYVAQESSLKKLFSVTYPFNNDLDDVLIKVCALNDFYSTRIFFPFIVARHIISLKIDKALKANEFELVNRIAKIKMNRNKIINFYSFATKYCSHHKPMTYAIYDSYVEKMLMHFKRIDGFIAFQKRDLKNYPKYMQILIRFQDFYGLGKFNPKEIDKYLWQAGKKYFPRKLS